MLTLTNVRKTYGTTVALDGLSLAVQAGEVLGLLGPNGAGKSTTVGLAVGLLRPDAGSVAINGDDPQQPRVRRQLGAAPQALAVYEALTGTENLRFFGELSGLAGSALRTRVAWAAGFVGLIDRAGDAVSTYSGGMKRRLNLACAVVHDPALVLLDEPTVGVDPQSRHLIFENILALKHLGRTIVYTTHYMEEAERLCDRVAIVDHGRLLAMGTVAELIAAHGGPPVLVAETAAGIERLPTTDPVGALNALAARTAVYTFHVERATLEHVFLQLTGRRLRD